MSDAAATPLDPPGPGSEALVRFLGHFRLDPGRPGPELLTAAARAFSRIPYENLTKLIKYDRQGSAARARRWPGEVIADHIALGAGGTCFSLTATLLHLVRALGWEARPILADRRYGPDTHCALLVWQDGAPLLLDPGFLLTTPIPLKSIARGGWRIRTSFNEVLLDPREDGRIDLQTVQDGRTVHRLTFHAGPADPGAFLRAWDASFGWDMMRYPLLTRVDGSRQIYLQDRRLLVRTRDGAERTELDPEVLTARIGAEFGVDPAVAAEAVAILRRKGEGDGRAPTP